MATITIANDILKLDYIEVVRDVLNSSTILNHRLEKDFESVQGDQVYAAVNYERNQSFQARGHTGKGGGQVGGYLPTAGEQDYLATWFPIKEMYGRLLVRERDIKASRNSKGALIRVLDTEMRHLIRDAKNTMNKYNYMDGTGVFAQIASVSTVAVTMDAEQTGDAAGHVETYIGARYFEPGMVCNSFVDVAGTTPGTAAIVSSVAGNVVTMAVDVSGTWAANEYVGFASGVGTNLAQNGLFGIVDDAATTYGFNSTLQNIDRSTYGWWKANVMRNAHVLRDVTLDMLQEAIDTSEIEGDGEVTCFITSYGIRRAILGLLVADKRFVAPYEMDLDGGFRALSYNGIPVVPDRHAPKHVIFGLDEPTIRYYQMSDFEWMEEDGAVLSRVVNEPVYEATMFLYREMGCLDPRNNVRIDDLNDPSA